ncbi:DNA-binding transcriptional regulator, LysR family [Duganella sp. CF402]|uniref:LysR family transcriptional regulator n=1 Tax=unclassified Duganella TaxID=2636909 RepID=UPI0008BB3C90|nr:MULTISPECIES: LysR family transcriptional regulator [unclassified Duganella]RZT08202.1 DNA-binding transcriptional LysR family regulator [Duganella sp. BK701]SEM02352.1 DNA-binding transcriptional regulator, LysR family [Duganella sp. CF402]
MRFNKLDLNLLVILNALLTEKSISRAAEKVHLSQPAASNALARLRAYFNDDLLVSSGRQSLLTPRAESLVEPVREVLMRIDSTIATPPEFNPLTEIRTVTFLVSDFTSTILMPALLADLSKSAPGIRIQLCPQTMRAEEAMEQGEADFLIIPSQFLAKTHPSVALFEEEYVCVTWEGNSKVGDHLSLDTFLECGHVMANFGGDRSTTFDGWFVDSFDVKRRVEVMAPTMANLPDLVIGTDRITTVQRRVAQRAAAWLPVKVWTPPIKIPHLVQALQWHKYRNNDPAIAWLRKRVIDIAAKI